MCGAYGIPCARQYLLFAARKAAEINEKARARARAAAVGGETPTMGRVQSGCLMKSRRFSLEKRIVFEDRRRVDDDDDDDDAVIRADLVSWRRRGRSRSRSRSCHLSTTSSSRLFSGFYSGTRFLSVPRNLAGSNETHASVVSAAREESIPASSIKSVSSVARLANNLGAKSRRGRIRGRAGPVGREGARKQQGRRAISACTLHYSPSRSLKWRRRRRRRGRKFTVRASERAALFFQPRTGETSAREYYPRLQQRHGAPAFPSYSNSTNFAVQRVPIAASLSRTLRTPKVRAPITSTSTSRRG